jgi:hypothetical protein
LGLERGGERVVWCVYLMTDRYESFWFVYLPTSAITASSVAESIWQRQRQRGGTGVGETREERQLQTKV